MAVPRILSQLADAARKADSPNLPKSRDLNKTFKPKSATVPNVAGQGRVRKPRTQILIENYRTNPNGVRNQFLSLPEDVQMNILQEIAEDFPPARPGDPISNVGQELLQFLTEGDGIADSPTRREVIMRDNRDAMRPGPSTSKGESFVTGEGRSKKFGSTGDERGDQFTELEIDDYLDNPDPEGFVDSSVGVDNPQNRYAKAANDASELGFTKKRLGEQESFRGNERFADVEDGQPTNKAIPGTGRKSDSADMEVSPAGQKYAQGQIDKNADPKYADMVAEKDNSSYFDSYQKGIVGMMNNSRNPDSLGGNRIDQLWGLIAKSDADPRTMFGSAEAMADVMLGHVNPKMVDNMMNPSPIGQQLPASQRSRMSYELIKEQLVKQINQKYGDGWGAASAADLNKADTLEPDGVNDLDAKLDAVTPVDGLDDLPNRKRLNQSGFGGDDPETYLRQNGYTDEDIERIQVEDADPDDPYGGGRGALLEEALWLDGQIEDAQAARGRDFRDDYDPIGPREEPSGAPPGSAKDRMMQAERNQQERWDLFQERIDELVEEGLSLDEAMKVMEGEGMGQEFLQAGLDDVERVELFGVPKRNAAPSGGSRSKARRRAKPKNSDVESNTPQFTQEELERISRNEAHVDGGKVVDGPPPKDVGPKEDAKAGDLDGTSEGDQIDPLESSATDLPDDNPVVKPKDGDKPKPQDTKPKDNEGKPDSTNDGNDGNDGNNQDGNNGDKVEKKDTKETYLNYPYRHPWKTLMGLSAAAGTGALFLGGTTTVNAPPDGSMRPAGDGSGEATPSELPPGMTPNGQFERDADGSLSDAGLKAFLDQQRLRRSRGPRVNTGTQTMGNWIR